MMETKAMENKVAGILASLAGTVVVLFWKIVFDRFFAVRLSPEIKAATHVADGVLYLRLAAKVTNCGQALVKLEKGKSLVQVDCCRPDPDVAMKPEKTRWAKFCAEPIIEDEQIESGESVSDAVVFSTKELAIEALRVTLIVRIKPRRRAKKARFWKTCIIVPVAPAEAAPVAH